MWAKAGRMLYYLSMETKTIIVIAAIEAVLIWAFCSLGIFRSMA